MPSIVIFGATGRRTFGIPAMTSAAVDVVHERTATATMALGAERCGTFVANFEGGRWMRALCQVQWYAS